MSSPEEKTGPRANILVADDSPTERRYLVGILREAGYQVTVAENGVEAVQLCYQNRPDLVVLDLTMPRLNGYQACRLLKSEPAFADLPVLLLTGHGGSSDRFWGLQTGADEFLTKDNVAEKLPGVVAALLERSRHGPGAEAPAASVAQVNEEFLMTRLADLLDRRLFEATVFNELSQIARALSSYEETVSAVLALMGLLFDHRATALLLVYPGQDHPELYVHKAKPATQGFVDVFADRMAEAWKQTSASDLAPPPSPVLFDEPPGDKTGPHADTLGDFIFVPFLRGDRTVGLLGLASARPLASSEEALRLLERIASQVYLVLENARLYREVHQLAITDGLTGLYNRRYAEQLLGHEVARSSRYNSPLSVLMLDIDFFKHINDQYGHTAGDLVLQRICAALRSSLRAADIVGRYGGEEILIILPQTPPDSALRTAQRLRHTVRSLTFPEVDESLGVTASVGVSGWLYAPSEGADPDMLVRQADEALYAAKAEGRDKAHVRPLG